MDLKRLKPLQGWRAFAGEVGVIVLGVLLALGAQQAVEAVQMQRDVAAFRQTINREIGYNLWAYRYRTKQSACVGRRLDQLDDWLSRASDGRAASLKDATRPNNFSLYRSAWDNRDPAVFVALPPAERQKYAEFYDELANNAANSAREREAWQALLPYEISAPLSDDDRRQLHATSRLARQLSKRIDDNLLVSFEIGRKLGVSANQPDGVTADDLAVLTHCPVLAGEPR